MLQLANIAQCLGARCNIEHFCDVHRIGVLNLRLQFSTKSRLLVRGFHLADTDTVKEKGLIVNIKYEADSVHNDVTRRRFLGGDFGRCSWRSNWCGDRSMVLTRRTKTD